MADSSGHDGDDDLDRRIAEAEARARPGQPNANGGEGTGMAMGIEFTGAVLVAAFLGWGVDHFAGTSPWGLMAGFVLGFATGVYSLIKASANQTGADRKK